MALRVLSTLAMLLAVETRRVAGGCSTPPPSCAACTPTTRARFALGAQLVWLLWAHPQARKAALLANAAPRSAFLPWITARSTTSTRRRRRSSHALSPFTFHDVGCARRTGPSAIRTSTRCRVRAPARRSSAVFGRSPSRCWWPRVRVPASAARPRAAGTGRSTAGCSCRDSRCGVRRSARPLASAVSTTLFGTRNLAASWPRSRLPRRPLLVAAGPRLRSVAAGLAIAAFAIGGGEDAPSPTTGARIREAAHFVDRTPAPRDVVIDATAVLSPGPLTTSTSTLRKSARCSGARTARRARPPLQRSSTRSCRRPPQRGAPLAAADRSAAARVYHRDQRRGQCPRRGRCDRHGSSHVAPLSGPVGIAGRRVPYDGYGLRRQTTLWAPRRRTPGVRSTRRSAAAAAAQRRAAARSRARSRAGSDRSGSRPRPRAGRRAPRPRGSAARSPVSCGTRAIRLPQ